MDILTFSMLCAILYIAPNNITPLGERPATVQASLASAPPSTSQTHLLRRLMHGSTNMATTIGLPIARRADRVCALGTSGEGRGQNEAEPHNPYPYPSLSDQKQQYRFAPCKAASSASRSGWPPCTSASAAKRLRRQQNQRSPSPPTGTSRSPTRSGLSGTPGSAWIRRSRWVWQRGIT